MRATILYHYFHPDDVVSARLFSDLAKHLVRKGWEVEAIPCRRGCRDEEKMYPAFDDWGGVEVRRIWRPAFSQRSSAGRILNSLWMLCAWALTLRRPFRRKPDVVILGTDPPFAPFVTEMFRMSLWRPKFVCWIHDLYPQVAVAAGMIGADSRIYRGLLNVISSARSRCEAVVDIGPAMRRLVSLQDGVSQDTITPWAMYEPKTRRPVQVSDVRRDLFGDARLGLLYSGSYGRAHDAEPFLRLASKLKESGVAVAFAVRGNCVDELRKLVEGFDANVKVVSFEDDPSSHFEAADIHLVSLKEGWSGMVVPSKFFGALAVGRPVLYAGPADSDISIWIREHGTGWVLNDDSLVTVEEEIKTFAQRIEQQNDMGDHCFSVYHTHFCKAKMLKKWETILGECSSS